MIYAKFTIVLKTLLDDPESKALIDKALSTYPLYTAKNNENFTKILTRDELNKKILDHFKYREIGFETFGRWLDELEIAMNEIMPYYNQKFCSEDIINGLEDIFGNLDVTEEFEQETSGTSTDNTTLTGSDSQEHSETSTTGSESSSETSSTGSDSSESNSTMGSDSKNVKADTPQSQITIPSQNIDSITHANEVNWNKDNSTSSTTNSANTSSESNSSSSSETSETKSSTSSGTKNETTKNDGSTSGTTKHTLHRKGNQGVNTYAHDMLEFRSLFMNITQEIINDKRIQELFMCVY